MIIGIDVDITFFNTGTLWRKWLEEKTGLKIEGIETSESGFDTLPYNLYDLYKDTGITEDEAMEFWENPLLYQGLEPIPYALDVVNALIDKGDEVGFITYCKSGHFSSKCKRLKELVPNLSFINVTKEKQYSCVDVMIDDRVEYLEKFPYKVEKVLIQSPYKQTAPTQDDIIVMEDWQEIGSWLWV